MQFKFKALVKVGSVVEKNSAMGASLSEPDTKLTTASCGNSYLKVGSSSMQGWRIQMEDAHTHLLSLPEDEKVSFFGVYDGHGGACASRYASCHLHKAIAQTKAFGIVAALHHGNLVGVAGTTAVIVMLKEDTLFCGNVGDSRAVISAGGVAEPLSFDHKPVNEGEIKRIFSAGGWVEFNRVNGNLAMSRALGDFIYKACHEKSPKEQIVTAYPDVVSRSLTDADEFIVLACDGVWDVMTNQEVVDFCRERIAAGLAPEKVAICEELLLQCLAPDCQMGGLGCDNMTVILVCLLRDKPYEELMKKCIRDRPPTPVRRVDEPSQQFVTPPLSPADSQPVLPSGLFPEAIGSTVAIENENKQEKVEKKNEIVDCAVGDVKQLEELKPKVVDYNANESEEAGEKEK
ncbi:protein phosphatase 2C [Trichinella nativa]|uniref:protein-serine/threonine phosphatase n=1 Tax=Trichinella nativa TaxID=6335 RepID=A0A1Y3EKH8_9BILA|nr:protein phosphatase 2C [Trichinella nativa]